MTRFFVIAATITLLVQVGCDGRDRAGAPGDPASMPATETPTPQTTAPGPIPGVDPIPQTAPGVIQEDTLNHPGQPGPDARPGI